MQQFISRYDPHRTYINLDIEKTKQALLYYLSGRTYDEVEEKFNKSRLFFIRLFNTVIRSRQNNKRQPINIVNKEHYTKLLEQVILEKRARQLELDRQRQIDPVYHRQRRQYYNRKFKLKYPPMCLSKQEQDGAKTI